MIRVLYYHYYLFYKNIWKDNDPHLSTILSLSFIISLIINGLIDFFLSSLYSIFLNTYIKLGVLIIIILFMHHFFRKEKRKKILDERPFIYSHNFSKIISIIFLFIGLFFLFFKADIVRNILHMKQ